MKKGTVKVTDLLGLGKKIWHSGDKVTESHFTDGHWPSLVNDGFIAEDPEEKEEAEVTATTDEQTSESAAEETPAENSSESSPEPTADQKGKTGKKK